MKQTNKQKIVLVDYENLPNIDLSDAEKDKHVEVYIFVGQNQKKIPVEVVFEMQRMGSSAHWVKVVGSGKNNLDFHLCFMMGQLHEQKSTDTDFFVLSKDKGFDNVIEYAKQWGRRCYRIEEVRQIHNPKAIEPPPKVPKKPKPVDKHLDPILQHLRRHKPQARPRKLRTFRNFLLSNFKELSEKHDPDELIRQLRLAGRIYEENGRMVYKLN